MGESEVKKIDWKAVAHGIRQTVDEDAGDGEGIGEDRVAETLEGFEISETTRGTEDDLFRKPETPDGAEPDFETLPLDPFFIPPTEIDKSPKKK